MKNDSSRISFRSILIGAVLSGAFAAVTHLLDNRFGMIVAANQIPLFPYILLILIALAVNPVCRLLRLVRRFTRAEMLVIFVMCMVSSGIGSFGLMGEWVPLMGSLFNRHWNNDQSEWNIYVEPFLNEHFFVSEPGIRQAAIKYREAVLEAKRLTDTYNEAQKLSRDGMDSGVDSEALPDEMSPQEVLQTYPERIAAQEERVAARRASLAELEQKAFERVETFRRGLSRDKRAFPGILPVVEEDNARTYFARLQRLFYGKRSIQHLREAREAIESLDAGTRLTPAQAHSVAAALEEAAAALDPVSQVAPLEEYKQTLVARDERLAEKITEVTAEMVALNTKKRAADIEVAREIEEKVDRLQKRKEDLEEEKESVSFRIERNQSLRKSTESVLATAQDITALQERVSKADDLPAGELRDVLQDILVRYPGFDASLRRYFLGDIPWRHWLGPILRWGLLIAMTYIVLMTFNVLIFRQWAYNEKLIYPLAELPELLVDEETDHRIIPSIFRSGLFWVGFAISASFLGWNLMVKAQVLPGIELINLSNRWAVYVKNTPLQPLGGFRSEIFFTMIGVAFLIPKKVSFSLWFFHILFALQLLLMCWAGLGQGTGSFPRELWYTLNFRTAEGGGALLVFASVVLWKSRRFILCAFSPASIRGLERDEQLELRLSSALFLTASLGIVLILNQGMGINIYYAIFGYIFMMVVTIGLVRAVAEGGILSYQSFFGPFHFIRHSVGFDKSWTAPHLVAPFMVYYSVFLLDVKTFIGPAMANSLKIRDDLRLKRGKFHLLIGLAILTAVLASLFAGIIMAYSSGADSMSGWFYNVFPREVFNRIAAMSKSPPMVTGPERFWMGFGAVFMAVLLFFRQRFFWIPHPIGAIMLVNPIMNAFWFSILIGWVFKSLITKYGNKDTYAKTRKLFVGLIVGELIIVMVATIVSLAIGQNMGIDLNRNQ